MEETLTKENCSPQMEGTESNTFLWNLLRRGAEFRFFAYNSQHQQTTVQQNQIQSEKGACSATTNVHSPDVDSPSRSAGFSRYAAEGIPVPTHFRPFFQQMQESEDAKRERVTSDHSDCRLFSHLSWVTTVLDSLADNTSCRLEESVLSVENEKTLIDAVQEIVAVGISPTLEKGLGIPIHKRISALSVLELAKIPPVSDTVKSIQLEICTNTLLKLHKAHVFRPVIVSKFLPDLIAALLQLSSDGAGLSVYDEELLKIVKETFKPLLISTLFTLQTGFGPNWSPSAAYKLKIGRLLSLSLMEPNGLSALVQCVQNNPSWKAAEALAKIVSRCPQTMKHQPDEYFRNICAQILELSVDGSYGNSTRVVASIIARLNSYHKDVVMTSLLDPMIEPFRELCENCGFPALPDRRKLMKSVEFVMKVTSNWPPGTPCLFTDHLCFIIPVFLEIADQVSDFSVDFKEKLEGCVYDLFLSAFSVSRNVAAKISDLFFHKTGQFRCVRKNIRFTKEDDGLSLSVIEESLEKDCSERIATIVRLTKRLSQKHPEVVTTLTKECLSMASDLASKLERAPKNDRRIFISLEQKSQVLTEYLTVTEFLESLIENCEQELLSQPLELLKMCQDEWKEVMAKILESLNELSDSQVPSIEGSASMLRDLLCDMKRAAECVQTGAGITLKDVRRDLKDPLLPVRGHGLIQLEKLIRSGDNEVLACRKELFDDIGVLAFLGEEDSYIFLSAINAMAALSSTWPDVGVPILLEQFLDENREPEIRVKVGEVLTKLCTELHDLVPKYSDTMVPAFLSLASNKEEAVRVSSVSSLAQLCLCLSFKMNQHINELIYCVENLLKFDDCPTVRRGAIHLVRSLLKGSSANMVEIIGDSLLGLYRLIKETCREDRDETVRLHAELCLEEIDENMKGMIMSSPQQLLRQVKLK